MIAAPGSSRAGSWTQAAECFKKAYLADARNFGALENLIEVFIRSGRHEPAAALASQWTRSQPRCARAWIARAKLNLLAGEMASARRPPSPRRWKLNRPTRPSKARWNRSKAQPHRRSGPAL